MDHDGEERTLLLAALEHLRSNPGKVFPLEVIRSIIGQSGVKRVKERRSEYVSANKASSDMTALLSSGAQEWWTEALRTLAYGRLVMAKPTRAHARALSRRCERLDESFAAKVPVQEQGLFAIHSLNDGAGWDDRWHLCIDFNFPLLRHDLMTEPPFKNTMRDAQLSILEEESAIEERLSTSSNPELTRRLLALVRRD